MKVIITDQNNIKRQYDITSNIIKLGREPDNNIVISDKKVSRSHLVIIKNRNTYTVRDLNSRNGTYINGKKIIPGRIYNLNENDTVRIGDTKITLSLTGLKNGGKKRFLIPLVIILSIITIIITLTIVLIDKTVIEIPETEETTDNESSSRDQTTEEESTSNEQTGEEDSVEEDDQADEETNEESEEQEQITYTNDFSLQDINGNVVSLSDYQGKTIVVLNFFATWCGPCVAEIPDFVEVYNQYKDKSIEFVGVSLDSDMNALEQFINDNGMNYTVLIDDGDVSNIWNIDAIPTTYILDKNGNILTSRVGQMVKSELVDLIEDNM